MGPCRGSGVLVARRRHVENRAVQPVDPDSQRSDRRIREAHSRGEVTMSATWPPVSRGLAGIRHCGRGPAARPGGPRPARRGGLHGRWRAELGGSGRGLEGTHRLRRRQRERLPLDRPVDEGDGSLGEDGPAGVPRRACTPGLRRRRGARVQPERAPDEGSDPREGEALRRRASEGEVDPGRRLGPDGLSRRQPLEGAPGRDRAGPARVPPGVRRPFGLGQLEGADARRCDEGDARPAVRADRTRRERRSRAGRCGRTRRIWSRSSFRSGARRSMSTDSPKGCGSRTVSA